MHISHRTMLAQPAFRRYTGSVFFAMMGNGLTYVITVWMMVSHQPDVRSTAILMACFWLPSVLIGPVAGVFVDHFPRKNMMLLCNVLRILILLLFILMYTIKPEAMFIYILCFMIGLVFSVYLPASMSFIREIIQPEELTHGNALVDISSELGNVIGMGMAGLVMTYMGEMGGFVVNVICYLLATVLLLLVHHQPVQQSQETKGFNLLADFREGFDYLWRHHSLMLIYGVQALLFIVYMTTPVLLGPYAKNILHASVREYGYLEALLSVGIVSGGLACPMLAARFGLKTVLAAFCSVGVVSFALLCQNLNLWQAYVVHLGVGLSFSIWPLVMACAQEMTDIRFQGRVQSLMNSVSGVLIILFYYALGSAHHTPVTHLYRFEVVIMMLIIMLMLLLKPKPEDVHR